jgi:hypothetical protein
MGTAGDTCGETDRDVEIATAEKRLVPGDSEREGPVGAEEAACVSADVHLEGKEGTQLGSGVLS